MPPVSISSTSGIQTDRLDLAGKILLGIAASLEEADAGDDKLALASDIYAALQGITTFQDQAASIQATLDALGTLSVQDDDNVSITGGLLNGIDLSDVNIAAVSRVVSLSADVTDVFVYDMSKDSDAGAFLDTNAPRTWELEDLGVQYRGVTAKMPKRLIIVAETGGIYLYDATKSTFPLWASCAKDVGGFLQGYIPLTVHMYNGVLYWAGAGTGLQFIDFFNDNAGYYATDGLHMYTGNVGTTRNGGAGTGTLISSTASVLNNTISGIAATAGTSTDSLTGLTTTTVAVATPDGVSVIVDDVTAYDIAVTSTFKSTKDIAFTADGRIAFTAQQSAVNANYYLYVVADVPTADLSGAGWSALSGVQAYGSYLAGAPVNAGDAALALTATEFTEAGADINSAIGGIVGSDSGLVLLAEDITTPDNGMVAYVSSDYTTGWMPGDIRGCWLSDTTEEAISDLVQDGDFNGVPAAVWTLETGWTLAAGVASCDGSQVANSSISQSITGLVAGRTYLIKADVTSYTAGTVQLLMNGGGTWPQSAPVSAATTISLLYTATGTSDTLYIRGDSDFTGSIDNVTFYRAEDDRSVSDNDLEFVGALTKAAVTTGAELVAYSGFSAANYIQRDYDASFDFATSDWTIMAWVKHGASAAVNGFVGRSNLAQSGSSIILYADATDKPVIQISDDGNVTQDKITAVSALTDTWTLLTAIRRDTELELWVNGVLDSTLTITNATGSLSQADALLTIGATTDGGNPASTTDMALVRISATAMSGDQVAKAYTDEVSLFAKDASCTLGGTSDVVKSVSYNADENKTFVSTGDGTSVFQDLFRVDHLDGTSHVAIASDDHMVVSVIENLVTITSPSGVVGIIPQLSLKDFILEASKGSGGGGLSAVGPGLTLEGGTVAIDYTAEHTWTGSHTNPPEAVAVTDGTFDLTTGRNNRNYTPAADDTITFTGIVAGKGGVIYLDNSAGHTLNVGAEVLCDELLESTISAPGVYQLVYYAPNASVVTLSSSLPLLSGGGS